jgi:aspartyl-tRNA(Asn)/glutamyl-tRNA(Gln) amidotransferase subunit A
MTQDEITTKTLYQASKLISNKEISPLELTHACLSRISMHDETINSFITVTADLALQQSRQAENALMGMDPSEIEELSPLFGIPFAYKDLYETAGILTTAGSTFFDAFVPPEDSAVVQKLTSAGVISLGKLNMHEIALGVTNVNPHFGACRNPWVLDRISGGSSGGSAAALAAGFIFGSMGSDTGGSIRIPSSLCSTVGIKPTYGRVSLKGILPLSWNLDHAGPMTRSVLDAALLLTEVAGYNCFDPYSVNQSPDDYLTSISEGVKNWRIALADDDFFDRTADEVAQSIQLAGRVFEDLGAHVESVPFPGARQAARANGLITVCDAAAVHKDRLEQNPGGFGADVLKRLRMGIETNTVDYIQARKNQVELRWQFERFFESYDLLLTPTTPVPAPPIEGPDAVEQAHLLTRYTAPFNLTGLPAISIPCGNLSTGLPIGLQIVSKPWGESQVLRAAFAYEQATEWHKEMPAL